MNPVARTLIAIGVVFIAAGLGWQFAGRAIQSAHLGHLPGDFAIERENFRLYFPLTTCILGSVFVSVMIRFIQFFSAHLGR